MEANLSTPIGNISILWDGPSEKIQRITLPKPEEKMPCSSSTTLDWELESFPLSFQNVLLLLQQYFSGKKATFYLDGLCYKQVTIFQKKVYEEVFDIPCGETSSYSEIARKVNSAPRAIGNAMATNRYPLIIPCHRVIAKNGRLTGYRSGLTRKKILLSLEQKWASSHSFIC